MARSDSIKKRQIKSIERQLQKEEEKTLREEMRKKNKSADGKKRGKAERTVKKSESRDTRSTLSRNASATARSKTSASGVSNASSTRSKTTSMEKRPSVRNTSTPKKNRTNKSKKSMGTIIKIAILLIIIGLIAMCSTIIWATWGMDFEFSDSFSRLGMNLSSVVYYEDEEGELNYYEQLIADQNRIWVDFDNVPQNMKNAFIAIEDQRFYKHGGVDIKRTAGAVANVMLKGDSSYGGSTITQQLIKNITADSERSKARKIREMVRAVILETKKSKDEILELYMNSIYLGHGANGVQAAAKVYFGKDVKDLTLVECTAIAGITQHPSTYDPFVNPEGNKEKRQRVLDKMLELDYISKEEYDSASNEELRLTVDNGSSISQSYFVDCLFEELLSDLMSKKGYTQQYATDLIYNGGLKIVGTVDPKIQKIMDDVYVNGNGFAKFYGEAPQSAMIISDPRNGQIKGIVGGRGKKQGARVLNRATQTYRQPGSTMKPISVYGPAIDRGVVTLATRVENSPLDINGWKPNNANKKFSGPVTLRRAVAHSYNLPAIRVLEELTVDTSFEYLTQKLHINLVEEKTDGDIVLSDKGFAPLALGGLTEGITVREMNSAYSTFANKGEYIEPTSYTKVYDSSGKLILSKTPMRNEAFSEETAYLVSQLLKDVVSYGTAGGSGIRGIDTCGKTGSTDDNMDRWFVGYTPYYVGTVWVGYDEQRVISYGGNNPALTIWSAVMKRVHDGLDAKTFEKPAFVQKAYVCTNTGDYATRGCVGASDYVNTKLIDGNCSNIHTNTIGTPGVFEPEEDKEKDKDKNTPSDDTGNDKLEETEGVTPPNAEAPPTEGVSPVENIPVISTENE